MAYHLPLTTAQPPWSTHNLLYTDMKDDSVLFNIYRAYYFINAWVGISFFVFFLFKGIKPFRSKRSPLSHQRSTFERQVTILFRNFHTQAKQMFSGKSRIASSGCTDLYNASICVFLNIFFHSPLLWGAKSIFFWTKKSEIWSNDFNLLNKHELNLEHKLFP